MMLLKFFLVAVFLITTMPLRAEEGRSVVVFASEKIMGEWIHSYFVSLGSEPELKFNECEMSVGSKLGDTGFVIRQTFLDDILKFKAREMHTAFGRYGNLSGMPNDMLVNAAKIADKEAEYLIACSVVASNRKGGEVRAGRMCANLGCKAVDTETKRRIGVVAFERCVTDGDKRAASVAVIKDACSQAGEYLAGRLK